LFLTRWGLLGASNRPRCFLYLDAFAAAEIEGAGAAVLAAPERFHGLRAGIVICGGNIDARLPASILLRGLVRERRLVRLHSELPYIPVPSPVSPRRALERRQGGEALAGLPRIRSSNRYQWSWVLGIGQLFICSWNGG
jgi:hypothetical protein